MTTTYKGASRSDGFTAEPSIFTVVTDPNHPLYDERVTMIPLTDPQLEALIESIYTYGVRKQIHVVRDGEKLIVKDGNQRVRCATVANERRKAEGLDPVQVPFKVVHEKNGESQSEKATLNIHIKSPPMVTARLALKLEQMGKSKQQIAVALGCTTTMVDNYLRLLDCAPAVQRAVEQDKASPQVARELAKLPQQEQEQALETMLAEGVAKGSAGLRAVSAVKRGEKVEKKTVARRMKNRIAVQELHDRLHSKSAGLKKDGAAVYMALRWVLGYRGVDKDQCDDVAECFDEMKGE